MTEEETKAFLAQSVKDITAELGLLSNDELAAVHAAEAAKDEPARRTTLLAAIEAEQSARAEQNGAAGAETSVEAGASETAVVMFSQEQVDAAVAEAVAAANERIAALEQELAVASATPKKAAKTVAEKARVLSIDPKAEGPFVRVAFTDGDNATLRGVADLEFNEADFARQGDGVVLRQAITFPESAVRSDLCRVWLLDAKGRAGAVCDLISALPVGGGTEARIAGGNLLFTLPKAA